MKIGMIGIGRMGGNMAQRLLAAGHEVVVFYRKRDTVEPLVAAGAVFMGGSMNVDEVDSYPALLTERDWLKSAIEADLPILGVVRPEIQKALDKLITVPVDIEPRFTIAEKLSAR